MKKQRGTKRPGLAKALSFLKPFSGRLIFASVLTASLTALGMVSPLLMRALINDVAGAGNWEIFPILLIGMAAIPLLRETLNVLNGTVINKVGIGIIGSTRKRVFERLMRLSLGFVDRMGVGGVKERIFGDVATISGVATGGLVTLVSDVVAIVFATVVMLRISPILAAATFGLLPLYYANYRFFTTRIRENTAVIRSRMDHVSSTLQERLNAHDLVQAYGQEREGAMHFASQAKQIMDLSVRGSAYSISFNQLSGFITKLGNTLLYCFGCYLFLQGRLGYGDVVAFCAYATQLLGPAVRFAAVANQFAQIGVSVERISQIVEEDPAIREVSNPRPFDHVERSLAISGVTFAYDDDHVALVDVTVDIKAGSSVAICGVAGSGKSTLAMLLRRFYDPVEGSISLDDVDIREYRLEDYRARIALVLPESTVFDETVRYNLCYGNPDATEEEMARTADALGLSEYIQSLPDGYDTRLGAGGVPLSAGNRQRIGIARALISKPLILVTDQATAVLDPISAERVTEAMERATIDKTHIMIVHRVLIAKDADEILVFDEGRLSEKGTYESLSKREDGHYRRLFHAQYGFDPLDQEKP